MYQCDQPDIGLNRLQTSRHRAIRDSGLAENRYTRRFTSYRHFEATQIKPVLQDLYIWLVL